MTPQAIDALYTAGFIIGALTAGTAIAWLAALGAERLGWIEIER